MKKNLENVRGALKKKWLFIVGTALLATSWAWVNLRIDPANEEKTEILEKLKHIETFPPLIDADVMEINQVKINKSKQTDSVWLVNMTNVYHQLFLTLWAGKGALLILRATDDSAREVNDILFNDSVGLGEAVEKKDAQFLQGHVAAFQQFISDWVTPVHENAVDRIEELSKRKGGHSWALVLVIVGTFLINVDKIKEFLHKKEERRELVAEIIAALNIPAASVPVQIAPEVNQVAPHVPGKKLTRKEKRAAEQAAREAAGDQTRSSRHR